MSIPVEDGFTIPVWVRSLLTWPAQWHPAWLKPNTNHWRDGLDFDDEFTYFTDSVIVDEFTPRDPNFSISPISEEDE